MGKSSSEGGRKLPESLQRLQTNPFSPQVGENKERVELALSLPRFSELQQEFRDVLGKKIVGQVDAKTAMLGLIAKLASNEERLNRGPLAKLIFAGPSGVGKNEISRVLAEFLFGDPEALTRFDCGKANTSTSLTTLFGSNPQYVGADIRPILSYENLFQHSQTAFEKGNSHPAISYSEIAILVFDEIDKAHPDVRNAIYQLLDEDEITLNKGEKLPTRNIIVICTTNLGQDEYKDFVDSAADRKRFLNDPSQAKRKRRSIVQQEISKSFGNAFLSRTEIVHFDELSAEEVMESLEREIQTIQEHYKQEGIILEIDPSILGRIGFSYNPDTGVRPLITKLHDDIYPLVESYKSREEMKLYWGIPGGIHFQLSSGNQSVVCTPTIDKKAASYTKNSFTGLIDALQNLILTETEIASFFIAYVLFVSAESFGVLPENYKTDLELEGISEEENRFILSFLRGNRRRLVYIVSQLNLEEDFRNAFFSEAGKGFFADICRVYAERHKNYSDKKIRRDICSIIFLEQIPEHLESTLQKYINTPPGTDLVAVS